jgi:hypothetical protein
MGNTYKDTFKIVAPGLKDSNNHSVICVPPGTYDQLARLSRETGVSMCRLVDQCVAFALERLEKGKNSDAE